jgi:hypothetical protein
LKWRISAASVEAAEKIRDRTRKTYPFDKLRAGSQGLKPSSARVVYGTAEAVPFVEICDDPWSGTIKTVFGAELYGST